MRTILDSNPAVVEGRDRLVDRFDPRLVNVLTAFGFAVPVIGYFWMLSDYAVNVVVGDQWNDVKVIGHSYHQLFDWSSLWAPNNQNRIFFPNLIVLALSRTTHFNVRTEEFISGLMLVASIWLLLVIHKRRSPATPWLYYCPVAILMLSIVQFEDTLWGFQLAWYLVLLCLVGTLAILDRHTLSRSWLALALAVAIIGSYSSLQGLLIWPAGLVLLWYRQRSRPSIIIWIMAAVATSGLYFWNLHTPTPGGKGYAFDHPLADIKFFLFLMGDFVGYPPQSGSLNNAVIALGAVIFVLAICTLFLYGIRRDVDSGIPIGASLVCFGLLFAVIVTLGRVFGGVIAAGFSRYTLYTLVTPLGIYLMLLQLPNVERRSILGAWISRGMTATSLRVVTWTLAVVFLIQIVSGDHYASHSAHLTYTEKAKAQQVLRNIDHETGWVVSLNLNIFEDATRLRAWARILEEHHLSVFASTSS